MVIGALVASISWYGSVVAAEQQAEEPLQAAEAPALGQVGQGNYVMEMAETAKDGKLSLAEFSVMHPGQKKLFNTMDRNLDGYIDPVEAKAFADDESSNEAKANESKDGELDTGRGQAAAVKGP